MLSFKDTFGIVGQVFWLVVLFAMLYFFSATIPVNASQSNVASKSENEPNP